MVVMDMYKFTDVSDTFRIQRLYTAFTQEIGSGYHFAGERHDFWELVIVLDGQLGVTAAEQTGVLHKGEAILHEPMEFHRVWYAGNESGKLLIFSFAAENVPHLRTRQFFIPDLSVPQALLEQIHGAYEIEGFDVARRGKASLACQTCLKRLEIFLLELFQGTGHHWVSDNSRSAENYIKIVRCLENHVLDNLSVEKVAELCNMSAVHAKQTFARYAGMGIRNYYNRLKIERAVMMLRSGCSVQETAAMLSFSSPNYFSTTFKRITGHAPTAYKTPYDGMWTLHNSQNADIIEEILSNNR